MGIFPKNNSQPRHILSVNQFTPEVCSELFALARRFEQGFATNNFWWNNPQYNAALSRQIVVGWFYQQSTRTDLCFAMAARHLGMATEFRSDVRQISSAAKGESEKHTTEIIAGYHPSILVIRHDKTGGVARMAQHSTVPVINAGDGRGEHPTQAALDLYTVIEECGLCGDISHLTIAIGGDLQGRAARSLALILADYGVHIIFISPEELCMGDDVKSQLNAKGIQFREEVDLEAALDRSNIFYWTRVQNDQRTPEERAALAHIDLYKYQLRPEHVERMGAGVKIMHPMPINREDGAITEIDPQIDNMPAAIYLPQARRGLYVRMAIFKDLLYPE